MEAQQIKTLVERALISYSGTTTANGGATGDTLVCSGLTTQPDYNRLSVLISEGAYDGLTADIVGLTTGGTINVEPSFPGQIVSGINFHIIPRLPAYSELIDIMGAGFDTATDSLAKLKDDLVSLLASIALTQKLAIKGTVDSIPAANQFIVAEFAGLGAGKFAGAALPWQVFVLRDQAGGSAAPQGEMQPVTAYDNATGQINHSAFTVALTADDEVVLLHPSIAHIDFSVTEKASINTEVDNALDTAIPGSPTADSINELIKGIGDFNGLTNFSTLLAILGIPDTANKPLYTVLVTDLLGHATHGLVQLQVDIAAIAGACALEATLGTHDTDIKNLLATIAGYIDAEVASILTDTDPKVMGRSQIFEKSITSAANATDVLVATITTQPCLIESVVIHADAAQTGDMTSCGVFGGADKVITFISAADAVQANLNAEDKQVAWEGAVRLAATKTIVISLVGTGATAVDLTITIKYRACASGGYLA